MPKSTLGEYLDDLIRKAQQGKATPVRKDLRGCKGCKKKMLRKMQDSIGGNGNEGQSASQHAQRGT